MSARRNAAKRQAPAKPEPAAKPGKPQHERTPERERIVRALIATEGVTHIAIAAAIGIAPKTLYARYGDLLDNRGPGRPAHVPSEAMRQLVANYKAVGLTDDEIASVMRLDDETLRKHYAHELRGGASIVTAKVGNQVILRALGKGPEAQRASEFYLNGWKNRLQLDAIRSAEQEREAEAARTLVDGREVSRPNARRVAFMLRRAALEKQHQAHVVPDELGETDAAPEAGGGHGV